MRFSARAVATRTNDASKHRKGRMTKTYGMRWLVRNVVFAMRLVAEKGFVGGCEFGGGDVGGEFLADVFLATRDARVEFVPMIPKMAEALGEFRRFGNEKPFVGLLDVFDDAGAAG